jgi:4-hydroxy-tetrahydrodipicolinate reductase
MIKVVVSGACGRMGSRIIANLGVSKGMQLAAALEYKNHPCIGMDAGKALHIADTGIKISGNAAKAIKASDVLIDFSMPHSAMVNLRIAAKNKIPAVVGTTGFSKKQFAEIKKIARRIPCVLSANMSVGVNLLFSVIRKIAPVLKDYDIEIVEAHHRMKKDAPSGTALKIAQIAADSCGINFEKKVIYGRKGLVGERKKGEIAIHSIRGGDIVGDHKIIFAGDTERIELVHRASNLNAFALGAIKAARFAIKVKPGLYNMESVLGIR